MPDFYTRLVSICVKHCSKHMYDKREISLRNFYQTSAKFPRQIPGSLPGRGEVEEISLFIHLQLALFKSHMITQSEIYSATDYLYLELQHQTKAQLLSTWGCVHTASRIPLDNMQWMTRPTQVARTKGVPGLSSAAAGMAHHFFALSTAVVWSDLLAS